MACVTCHSPQEALAALRRDSCQLALVDLNYVEDTISGKEGLALITALRQVDEALPIVAMTGWGTIGIAVEAMRRGGFCRKALERQHAAVERHSHTNEVGRRATAREKAQCGKCVAARIGG